MDKLKPIKSLGQNFLNDPNIQKKIVLAIEPKQGDLVLEIGPGEGAITQHLVDLGVDLTVVDKDNRSTELLKKKFNSQNINIFNQDILEYEGLKVPTKVIGNLPYYISTQILFYIFERRANVINCVIMVQKEVAQRIVSAPNTKEYGKLSVLLQTFFEIEKVTDVSPNCFYPKPKVWSSVIKLTPKNDITITDNNLYWKIVKTAFSQRRKKLSNTLKPIEGFNENEVLKQFYDKRAENLSTDDYIFIYQQLKDQY